MSPRELFGLMLIVAGLVLVPAAWSFSRTLWLLALGLFCVGGGLFYTERMLRREANLERENTGNATQAAAMPADIHNYTGWRSGGRSGTMDQSSGTESADQ